MRLEPGTRSILWHGVSIFARLLSVVFFATALVYALHFNDYDRGSFYAVLAVVCMLLNGRARGNYEDAEYDFVEAEEAAKEQELRDLYNRE